MDTSGLQRHLPSQAGARNRELAEKMLRGKTLESLKTAAVEQLATIPEAWLDRLHDENVAYVALGYGESLADTELLRGYTPEKLQAEAAATKPIRHEVESQVEAEIAKLKADDPSRSDFVEYGRADLLAEKLGARLHEEEIGFQVRVLRGSTPLEHLFNECGVADDPYHDLLYPEGNEEARETKIFRNLLTELNGEGVIREGEMVDPESDVLLLPYRMKGDKRISPVSLASYSSITGQQMDNNYGANYWANRLIVLDDEVVAVPSRKVGYHSVLLHESGHAIDYAAESVPELNHRATVDKLYESDLQRARQGDVRFLTSRAGENVREYFAEAVEAYLTAALPQSEANVYKVENNHEMLKERNPELFAYVDRLMRWPGSGQGPSAD
jgi:hypothetical protein